MNNVFFVVAQIIGFIAFLISLIAYHRDKKEKILGSMIVSNILNLIHYFLLNAYSGCITKIIGICRDTFVILKEKNKLLSSNIFLFLFILIYIIVGVYTYSNIWSILPLIAAIIYIIPIWNGNEIKIKRVAFICYFLWLIYNVFVFSIAGIVSNMISIISTFIAIINTNKSRKV